MAQDTKKFPSIVGDPLTKGIRPDYYSDGGSMKNIKMYQDISNLANYEFALDESAREFETASITRALQVQQARESYRDVMQQRDIQMNAQLEAYGRNQEFVAQQLAFNREGAERALGDAQTVLGDRLKQVQLQEQSLALQRQEQAIATAAQKAALDVSDFKTSQDTRLALAQANRNKALRDSAISLSGERAGLGFRSQNLAQQRARLGVQRQELGVDQSRLRIDQSRLGIDQSRLGIQEQRLGIDEQRLGIDQQRQEIQAQELALDRKAYGLDYELDEFTARTAYELQQNQIKQILDVGTSRASGRQGVSANRAQQTILALAGFNSARLNDSLIRFTANTAKERGFLEREAELVENQKGFVDRRSQFVDRQSRFVDSKSSFVDRESAFVDRESGFVDRQQGFINKEGEFIDTQSEINTAERGVFRDEQKLRRQESSAQYETAVDSAEASKRISRANNAVDRERLRQLEVVTNNRFKMNRSELGETLLSALNGYQQSKEQIFFDKFKADAQAYANRMATPQFADAPDEPYEIPEITFIPPPIPIEVPKGQVQKQPQQKTSIFGKILQIGGMVASAISIPLTAGATTPAAVGQAVALAGGGAALSGIGSSGWI